MEKQIKSKSRVSDFGEVYTARKQVTDMVDLVNESASDVNSTVLEPACGNGNFLAETLRRKLDVVKQKYKKITNHRYTSRKSALVILWR